MGRTRQSRRNLQSLLHSKPPKNPVLDKMKMIEAEGKANRTLEEEAMISRQEKENSRIIEQSRSGYITEAPKQKGRHVIITNQKENRLSEDKIAAGDFIKNDERIAPLLNCLESIENFLSMTNLAIESLDYVNRRFTDAEHKKIDVEHNIELEWENCYRSYLSARQLKMILMERRDMKDLKEIILPICEFSEKYKDALSAIQRLADELKKRDELRKNRVYYPRSDLDLPVSRHYRELPADERFEIEMNYKKKRGIA